MLKLVPLLTSLEDHRRLQKAESQNDGLAECAHFSTLVVDKNVKCAVAPVRSKFLSPLAPTKLMDELQSKVPKVLLEIQNL
jgi:hypothetical protein